MWNFTQLCCSTQPANVHEGIPLLSKIQKFEHHSSISWIISPFKFWTTTIFLHAHLQVVYYNCVKFQKTPISRYTFTKRGGAQLLLNCLLNFYELYTVVVHNMKMSMKVYRCCLKFGRGDNSTYTFMKRGKFWTATIFLHAHLQVVYYKCVKFHKTPISRLGGVALIRYTTPLFMKV
jgi:trehalose utilization protein